MSDINWVPGLVVLGGASLAGVYLAWRSHSAAPITTRRSVEERKRDLSTRKDELLQLIRELDDTRASRTDYESERARLLQEAAETARALDHADDVQPAPVVKPTVAARNPQLVGALWGGGIVAFIAALAWGIQTGSSLRPEGGSMTGGESAGMGGGGGGGRAQQAPAQAEREAVLSAADQAELDKLAAAVAANPADLEAKNKLGHAYIGLNKVMDAFKLAEEVIKKDPENAEARTHQGVVLMAIGDQARAGSVFDKVLATAPTNIEALGYRGAVYYQAGDTANAISIWEKAKAVEPAEAATFDNLIAMARKGPPAAAPAMGGGAMAGGAEAAQAGPAELSGTITLGAGVAAPQGTVFVYVRPEGVDGGPPMRAARIPANFPAEFTISAANAPMGGELSGRVVVSAKIDVDGNPSTKSPDDLVGKSTVVEKGATGISITLQKAGQ